MRRSIAVVLALGILAVLLLNAATALADSPATKVETALQMRSATTKTQGRLALYATLATADGQPVSDRTINFYEQVQFLGDRRAYLGSASTDASGQAILTYEPGGTPLGDKLRDWLKKAGREVSPQTELVLFNAARALSVSEVIKPNLAKGRIVISDRYTDSTTVYQGYGRGLDLKLVKVLNHTATGGLKPDLTVLLDIRVDTGLARKEQHDRFEQEELAFHERVREGYLALAKAEPGRWLYGDTAVHLARVKVLKRQTEPYPYAWVLTDTTYFFLAGGKFDHNRYPYLVANRADAPRTVKADIVGHSCFEDILILGARVPEVEPGDVIAFLETGAYQEGSASNFNALPRPASVLVHGSEAELVKRAETLDDVWARDIVPERVRTEPTVRPREAAPSDATADTTAP